MGILLMRYLLTVILFLSSVSVSAGDWSELLQKEFPKTPGPKDQGLNRMSASTATTSDLMKEDYRGIPAEWRKSWHYKNGVSCQDCHGGDPKDAARSMKPESGFVGVPKPKKVPEFCGKCHLGIKENYLESGHGKALKATGRGPNCVTCHHSHDIQKADINIINEKLCGVCHTYDRAKEMKAALLLTEQKINEIDRDLKTLKAGLISTQDEEKVLFQTQAEYRTLFHTVDVKMVQARTEEFSKKLATINAAGPEGLPGIEIPSGLFHLYPVDLYRPGNLHFPFKSEIKLTQVVVGTFKSGQSFATKNPGKTYHPRRSGVRTAEENKEKANSTPVGMKKVPQWTLNIATSITIEITRAPKRVNRPKSKSRPPPNSPIPASTAHSIPGVIPNFPAKKPAVAVSPLPPSQPKSFWPPWARKITPRAILKGMVAQCFANNPSKSNQLRGDCHGSTESGD